MQVLAVVVSAIIGIGFALAYSVDVCLSAPVSSVSEASTEKRVRLVTKTGEGSEFTIGLDSNRTTGYQWRLAKPLDGRLIRLVKTDYVAPATNVVGAGGREIWTFVAVAPGETVIVMEYVRPWEKEEPPARTALIEVSIVPSDNGEHTP